MAVVPATIHFGRLHLQRVAECRMAIDSDNLESAMTCCVLRQLWGIKVGTKLSRHQLSLTSATIATIATVHHIRFRFENKECI